MPEDQASPWSQPGQRSGAKESNVQEEEVGRRVCKTGRSKDMGEIKTRYRQGRKVPGRGKTGPRQRFTARKSRRGTGVLVGHGGTQQEYQEYCCEDRVLQAVRGFYSPPMRAL